MQGLDRRVVQLLCSLGEALLHLRVYLLQPALVDSLEYAVVEFGSRFLCECDRGDLVRPYLAAGDQIHYPPHQCFGLTGAGAGLDEQRLVETVLDPITGSLICDRHDSDVSGRPPSLSST